GGRPFPPPGGGVRGGPAGPPPGPGGPPPRPRRNPTWKGWLPSRRPLVHLRDDGLASCPCKSCVAGQICKDKMPTGGRRGRFPR
ncbi:MAG: hypothetical protein F4075_11975, partial [Acidobacteria bacterium]|nr:hypothetical protein [Acidobacteriota bacterium]